MSSPSQPSPFPVLPLPSPLSAFGGEEDAPDGRALRGMGGQREAGADPPRRDPSGRRGRLAEAGGRRSRRPSPHNPAPRTLSAGQPAGGASVGAAERCSPAGGLSVRPSVCPSVRAAHRRSCPERRVVASGTLPLPLAFPRRGLEVLPPLRGACGTLLRRWRWRPSVRQSYIKTSLSVVSDGVRCPRGTSLKAAKQWRSAALGFP